MPSPIEQAIRQICEEKGLAYESVLDAIEAALAAAYRKDFGDKMQNNEAEFDPETGDVKVFDVKTVVEDIDLEELERLEEERKEKSADLAEAMAIARKRGDAPTAVSFEDELGPRFNPKTEIMLKDAKELKKDAELGEVLRTELPVPGDFGRMAAMTAKQVITQKLREAEREIIFSEYKEHEGEVLHGTVQRKEGRIVLVDIGRTTGILRPEDQVPNERYVSGSRIKVFVKQVGLTNRGPEILLSRTSEELVKKLFEVEIPEVSENVVLIKGVAREPGSRSKVAVFTEDEQIDPIGACIGQRGTRIQTIITELGGEKIDIIEWSENPIEFISNSLSPAKIDSVELNEDERSVVVDVPADQLSLAIGKGGQNVRLAAKLTGWKINISEDGKEVEEEEDSEDAGGEKKEKEEEKTESIEEETTVEEKKEETTEESKTDSAEEKTDE